MKLDFALDPTLTRRMFHAMFHDRKLFTIRRSHRRVALLDETAVDVVPSNRPRQCANTYRGLTPKFREETRLP